VWGLFFVKEMESVEKNTFLLRKGCVLLKTTFLKSNFLKFTKQRKDERIGFHQINNA
jgi:hypothetical protein